MRMQKSQLSSAVDRRRLTLLSDAVPGVVSVTTSAIGSLDGGRRARAEDIGDALLVRTLPCRVIAGGAAGSEQRHSMASVAFRLIGRIVIGT